MVFHLVCGLPVTNQDDVRLTGSGLGRRATGCDFSAVEFRQLGPRIILTRSLKHAVVQRVKSLNGDSRPLIAMLGGRGRGRGCVAVAVAVPLFTIAGTGVSDTRCA